MISMTVSILRPWRSKVSRCRSPLPLRWGPGMAGRVGEQLEHLVDRDADAAGVGDGDGTHGGKIRAAQAAETARAAWGEGTAAHAALVAFAVLPVGDSWLSSRGCWPGGRGFTLSLRSGL